MKAYQKQLAECLGAPSDLIESDGAAVHLESPDFDSPDGSTSLSESISVDRMARSEQFFTVLHQSNFGDCMSDALGGYMKKVLADSDDPEIRSATLGDVGIGQLSAGDYGDDTVALRATIPVTAQGESESIYIDALYVRHANAVASISFQGFGTPVDPETSAQFTRLATRKMVQQDFSTG